MLLTSLPVTPPLTPPQGQHFRLLRGGGGPRTTRCFEDASLNLFIVRACATQFVKNIGVFDSPRVRFRILGSSSGTSPASPASSASAPAKDADDASDAGDVAHAGEGTSGNQEGKGGKDLNRERGGERFREEREKIWGKKDLREEREKI